MRLIASGKWDKSSRDWKMVVALPPPSPPTDYDPIEGFTGLKEFTPDGKVFRLADYRNKIKPLT